VSECVCSLSFSNAKKHERSLGLIFFYGGVQVQIRRQASTDDEFARVSYVRVWPVCRPPANAAWHGQYPPPRIPIATPLHETISTERQWVCDYAVRFSGGSVVHWDAGRGLLVQTVTPLVTFTVS